MGRHIRDYRCRPVVNWVRNPSLELDSLGWDTTHSGEAPGESSASRITTGGHTGNAFGRQTWFTRSGAGGSDMGNEIRDIALNPEKTFLYVQNYSGGKMWKFNTSMGDSAFDSTVFIGNNMKSMAIDSLGNFWVSRTLNSPDRTEIEKRSSAGVILATITGTSSGYGSVFGNECKIAIDSLDNVYIADPSVNKIIKLDSTGTYVLQWGGLGSTDGLFDMQGFMPGIAIGPSNDVFVTGYDYNAVFRCQRFTSAGVFVSKTILTTNTLRKMSIRAVDSSGNLYVTGNGADHGQIFKREQVTNTALLTINVADTIGSGSYPVGSVVLDNSGNIYAYVNGLSVTRPQPRVRKYSSSGSYINEVIRINTSYVIGGGYRIGTSGTFGNLGEVFTIGAGIKYGLSVWVRSSISQRVRVNIEYAGFYSSTISGPETVLVANTWMQIFYEGWYFTSPGGMRALVGATAGTGAQPWSANDTFDVDDACFYEFPKETRYFDGNTPRFAWNGPVGNSYSVGYPLTSP